MTATVPDDWNAGLCDECADRLLSTEKGGPPVLLPARTVSQMHALVYSFPDTLTEAEHRMLDLVSKAIRAARGGRL